MNAEKRLEQYTLRYPQEVLLVSAEIEGEADEIVIFKGFSSSLARPTAFDPDIPVLPDDAVITNIDRLMGPYTPNTPRYLERGLTWEAFEQTLADLGL